MVESAFHGLSPAATPISSSFVECNVGGVGGMPEFPNTQNDIVSLCEVFLYLPAKKLRAGGCDSNYDMHDSTHVCGKHESCVK